MTTPTAEDSRALMKEPRDDWDENIGLFSLHLAAALDREAALTAERDDLRAEVEGLDEIIYQTARRNTVLTDERDTARAKAQARRREVMAVRAAFTAWSERLEAERDAARAEAERLRSEKQAAENMSTVRAIDQRSLLRDTPGRTGNAS